MFDLRFRLRLLADCFTLDKQLNFNVLDLATRPDMGAAESVEFSLMSVVLIASIYLIVVSIDHHTYSRYGPMALFGSSRFGLGLER